MKKYIFLLCLLTALFTGCREEQISVAVINDAQITAHGSKIDLDLYISGKDGAYNQATISEIGVFYSTTNQNPTEKDERASVEVDGVPHGTSDYNDLFYGTISGFAANTTYYARPFAHNKLGFLMYDQVITFTTTGSVTVTTNDATSIAAKSAQLNGHIRKVGNNVQIQERGFVWSTVANPTTTSNRGKWSDTQDVEGTFNRTISSLTSNTKYFYRAYAKVDGEIVYGMEKSFTTNTPDETITMTLNDATNVSNSSATVSGTVTIGVDARSSVTEIGIKYVPASEATFDKLVYTRNITADQGTYSVSGKIDFSDLYPDYYYFLYYIKNGQTYSTTSKYVSRGGASQGALTVAQFKAQPDDPEAWYSVTGIIYRIENSTYGNLYLADETGLLAVYGVTKTKRTGSSNDQSFSSLGLKTGDYVTICGPKKTYNGVIEMDNGYFIAKKTALTSETSFTTFALEPTTTTTITLGTPTNIYVSADEHYISYEYTYVALTLYFGTSCLRIPIWFFDYHDPVTVIQQRTYRVKAENMMGSVWGSDVIDASDGYVAYLNHDSFTTYFAGSTTFGQSAPYYVTDGTMTVSQSGNNTRLQINFTTKNGSTIKGDLVVDLISKLQLTPNSN